MITPTGKRVRLKKGDLVDFRLCDGNVGFGREGKRFESMTHGDRITVVHGSMDQSMAFNIMSLICVILECDYEIARENPEHMVFRLR